MIITWMFVSTAAEVSDVFLVIDPPCPLFLHHLVSVIEFVFIFIPGHALLNELQCLFLLFPTPVLFLHFVLLPEKVNNLYFFFLFDLHECLPLLLFLPVLFLPEYLFPLLLFFFLLLLLLLFQYQLLFLR